MFDLFSKLADIILEKVPSDHSLFVIKDGNGKCVFEKEAGMTETCEREFSDLVVSAAFEKSSPVVIPDTRAGGGISEKLDREDGRPRSILCYPWTMNGRPCGCAYLARGWSGPAFSRENLEFLALTLSPVIYLMGQANGNRRRAEGETGFQPVGADRILGESPAIRRVRSLVGKLRESDAPVFIWGESGTGKELVAKTIHETGNRRGGQFIAVNCGAIPENLLESELFGHARGAFTGALRDKVGLIEDAHGGTFFLDEIGDLPLSLQAKLLRVLEEKKIRRIGENRFRPVDVRFISATNKNLEEEIARKNFREDLFYRLKIIGVEIPPLRARKEDILPLVDRFLAEFSRSPDRARSFFSPLALDLLLAYPWPGNVRELQNEIQRCLVISEGGMPIREDVLSPKINPRGDLSASASPRFLEAKAEFEKRYIRDALARCNYHRTRTAAEIGLTRQGLFKLIKKHRIDVHKHKPIGELKGGSDCARFGA